MSGLSNGINMGDGRRERGEGLKQNGRGERGEVLCGDKRN